MQHILNELFGLGDNIGNVPNKRTDPFHHQRDRPTGGSIESHQVSFKMDSWQSDIQKMFESHSNDTLIISASPAAGKTKPLMNGYSNILQKEMRKGLSNKRFPRILFITPRTQLASQMAQDFLSEVVLPITLNMIKSDTDKDSFTADDQRKVLHWIEDNMITTFAGSKVGDIRSPKFGLKPIVTATYNHASKLLKEYPREYQYIIIDELQEYLPNPGKPIVFDIDKLNDLITIVDKGMHPNHKLVLATGSVNMDVLERFQSFLEETYSKKVKIVGSNARTNRSKLTLIPFTEMRSSLQLSQLIKQLASNSMTNNLFLMFTVKEKPINQLSIVSTLQELVKILPIIHKDWMITASERTRSGTDFKSDQKRNPVTKQNLDTLGFFDLDNVVNKKNNDPTYNEDNLLFQCVIRGVGFIIGNQDDDQKSIVQSLFMEGKLHTMIASDAVGVGANVLARRLFIPTFHKFEDGVFGPVNASNLIQLLNRAGRNPGAIPYAAVYVAPEDIDFAKLVLSTEPGSAPGTVDIEVVLDKVKGHVADKHTKREKILNLFKEFFKGAQK